MSASAYLVVILCLAVNTDASLIKGIESETDGGEKSLLKNEPAEQTIFDGNLIAANKVSRAPRNLRIVLITNTSISLEWDKPRISRGPILRYRVSWKTSTSDDEVDTKDNSTSFTVDSLAPYQKYNFKVQAITASGPGDWSKELDVMTSIGVPHRPLRFRHESVGNTTVGLTWLEPWPSTGPVLKYHVRFDALFHHGEQETNSTSLKMEGLEPYLEYTFKAQAITEAGPGEWSEDIKVKTDIGTPRLPRQFFDRRVTNTTIGLMWLEPYPFYGPILKYRIFWKNSTDNGEQDTNDNSTYYTMERMTPYVEYVFEMLGITSAGPGETSDILKVRTDIGVPHAPVGLSITTISNTTVVLKWEEPKISTGPILKYRIHWKNSTNEGEVDTEKSSTSFTMDKLTPDAFYTFKVLGITKAGPGQWSEDLEVEIRGECECKNGFCEKVEGNYTCKCHPEWGLLTPTWCSRCDCGRDSNCTYSGTVITEVSPTTTIISSTKACICKDGYEDFNGFCKEHCEEDKDCPYRQSCVNETCICSSKDFGENCDKASDDACEVLVKGCIGSGGSCGYKANRQIFCNCTDNTWNDTKSECEVSNDVCVAEKKLCRETKGECKLRKKKEGQGTDLDCDCPGMTAYVQGKGCAVRDDMCDLLNPKCRETKGECKIEKGKEERGLDFDCVCPGNTTYVKDKGCTDTSL